MSEAANQEDLITADAGDDRHDPLMTLFIAAIMLLLLTCVVLMLVANSRPPAGL